MPRAFTMGTVIHGWSHFGQTCYQHLIMHDLPFSPHLSVRVDWELLEGKVCALLVILITPAFNQAPPGTLLVLNSQPLSA